MGKRIAFVGAGAVGGYAGAHMTAAGHDVTLIDPWPEHVDFMKAEGMEIFGMTPEERLSVSVNALHITEVQALAKQKPIDIAFVAVKATNSLGNDADPAVLVSLGLRGVDAKLHQRGASRRSSRVGTHAGMHRDRRGRRRSVSARAHSPRLCQARRHHIVLRR